MLRSSMGFVRVLGLIAATACGSAGAAGAATPSPTGQPPEADIGDAEPPADDVVRVRVPIEGAPAIGAESPLVVIVVFTDFECGHCASAVPTIAELRRRYPAELRVVFRQFPLPFHRHAEAAAEAALEAFAQRGNAGFVTMHDRLFGSRYLDAESLGAHARATELDLARFDHALASHAHRDAIRADRLLGTRLGVEGTPTFFVNGRPVVGAVPVGDLDAIVREEIALARREIARGAGRDDVYARRMAAAGVD